jgi:hypothetical protein
VIEHGPWMQHRIQIKDIVFLIDHRFCPPKDRESSRPTCSGGKLPIYRGAWQA